ncbi:MAG TPA: rRNA maturation RNase YbeY [Candidatus Avamphibacillus intestinigallinarum]|nr:rRNA maturation RNase YbeY [Candidatus Avamphibacillus intestinigallinarum]
MIEFNDEKGYLTDEQISMLEALLNKAIEIEDITEEIEMSVSFTTNEEIQVINKQYRQIDRPTDVISFALEEEAEGELEILGLEHMPRMLGDIIISMEKAKEQALEYNHSLDRELGFLAVHGFLHLLGYDHMNQIEEEKMFARQNEILEAFGLER